MPASGARAVIRKPSRWLIWAKCTISEVSPRSSGAKLAPTADWIRCTLPSPRRARGTSVGEAMEKVASSPSAARKPAALVAINGL